MHFGTPRHSGRYPWGSGDNATGPQHNKSFLDYVADMKRQGLSEAEIAKGVGMTTTQLRAAKSIAKNQKKASDIAMAQRLSDKGYSNRAIAERMGLAGESSVRALLAPGVQDKLDVLQTTSNLLRDQVNEKQYVDIGTGVENHLNISSTKLATAVAVLQEEGYQVHTVQVDQVGTNQKTSIKVLTPPGTTYVDAKNNRENIKQIMAYSEDGGRTYQKIHPPVSVDSKRVDIRYAEQGGTNADGVIYVRPGVEELSLGSSRYAQVRIAVDGTHYIKGVAVYKDDLPAGTDIVFNTNKSNTGHKLDALKPMDPDPDNPFGSMINRQHGVMNIVNEQGDWEKWSRSLSTQVLSKQNPSLARDQLAMTLGRKQAEFDEIMALTNPTVKRKLLESFADDADSSAVHLKAAALPKQANHVILPIESMKPTEVYAPNYENGERVVLIRHPHGGIFEIPELVVNNRNPEAKKMIGSSSRDAIGIHSKVAERLSGADFDGDTVLVIPNRHGKIKTAPVLEKLKGFDPKKEYPEYPGMKVMTEHQLGFAMGDISNLITDMTIKGANLDEISRAVRHSMVVIDAYKHKLNYKQSAIDRGIPALKAKYQGKTTRGASTLISRATSRTDVRDRKPRPAAKGGPIDKTTGQKVFEETGVHYVDAKGKKIYKTVRSTKLAETQNAHSLSSGTVIERIYADHSNALKSLANKARLESIRTKAVPYSPSAKKAYAAEVTSLNHKLSVAISNRPLERQAQVIANAAVRAKRAAYPDMDAATLKKVKAQALIDARATTGAGKKRVQITESEWAAIQAGAITNNKLTDILSNADLNRVKELATPRERLLMTTTKKNRAQSMLASGYTQAEVAKHLGVSLSTLKNSLS
jgi:predicted transcriptional regulator